MKQKTIAKFLSPLESLVQLSIFLLMLASVILIFVELFQLGLDTLHGNMQEAIAGLVAVFLLVKVFGIFHTYLCVGSIKVERVVEVGIIAIVSELMLHAFTIEPARLYGLSVLLLSLGGLFFVERHYSSERNPDIGKKG